MYETEVTGLARVRKRSVWDEKKIWMFIFSGVLLLSIVTGYFLVSDRGSAVFFAAGQDPELAKRLNILLMAVDTRPGEDTGRTDSLILVSIDREKKQIYMLSIPRDTRLEIPGHGVDKINSAHVVGGAELTQKVVEDLTGIKLNYYVKTDFNGFKKIIDTLGGVTIDVEKDLRYTTIPGESINLKKGVQLLDGDKALQYVRFRNEELGDISRTQRQQKFLTSLANETFSTSNIFKLPTVIPQWFDVVETDIPMDMLLSLAKIASDLGESQIHTMTLPGQFYDLNGISYWKVDPEHAKENVRRLLLGEVADNVIDENTGVPVPQNNQSQSGSKTSEKQNTNKVNPSPSPTNPKNPTNPTPPDDGDNQSGSLPPTDSGAGGGTQEPVKPPTEPVPPTTEKENL